MSFQNDIGIINLAIVITANSIDNNKTFINLNDKNLKMWEVNKHCYLNQNKYYNQKRVNKNSNQLNRRYRKIMQPRPGF